MRILASTYACEPGKGSEPGVGWNWIKQISRFHELWVLTRSNNAPAINAALVAEPMPSVHWVYFDLPRWARFWKHNGLGVRVYYYVWQFGAYLKARRLNRRLHFDLVHHVTFVNYWLPSFMALLPIPFVWGPVGGAESAPPGFWQSFDWRAKVYELARNFARRVAGADPFVRLTARRACVGFSTTAATEQRLRKLGCRNVIVYSEARLSNSEIRRLAQFSQRQSGPFRLLSTGRLLHWKGFDLGLRAFAALRPQVPDCEYWIIGNGPERKRLQQLARQLGIEDRVTFWGALPREQVLEKLADCDVLVHPSLHDSGGWVCLEMMAAGRPVVCLDLGGPATQITESTGIKVGATTAEEAVAHLSAALVRLAADPALRAQMSEAGRRRVREHFDWDRKGEWMNRIYQGVGNAIQQ